MESIIHLKVPSEDAFNVRIGAQKVKRVSIRVGDYSYTPKEYITAMESSLIFSLLLLSGFVGNLIDIEFYITENVLDRHFVKDV